MAWDIWFLGAPALFSFAQVTAFRRSRGLQGTGHPVAIIWGGLSIVSGLVLLVVDRVTQLHELALAPPGVKWPLKPIGPGTIAIAIVGMAVITGVAFVVARLIYALTRAVRFPDLVAMAILYIPNFAFTNLPPLLLIYAIFAPSHW